MKRWKTLAGSATAALLLCFGGPGVSASETDAVSGASTLPDHDYAATWQLRRDQLRDGMTRWADELGLTAQQRSDLQIITADYMARFRDLAQLGRDTAKDLLQTLPDDVSYQLKTQEASALAASSAAELVTLLAEMRGKLYSVLTADQRQQFHDLLESHRDQQDQ
jgi:Spy/CpxP family protein refolding chaperone